MVPTRADVICLQETRFHELSSSVPAFQLPNYRGYFFNAERKGYSGVAIYTKYKPISVQYGLHFDVANTEGRYIEIELEHCRIASIYFPSGTSGEERQRVKFHFMQEYMHWLRRPCHKPYIICGDWNIAHQEIDLTNWRANQDHSGFLPQERFWLDAVFELGYVDAFRRMNLSSGEYTWWKHAIARSKNVGWRIDYQIADSALATCICKVYIDASVFFSDHAPVIIDYNIKKLSYFYDTTYFQFNIIRWFVCLFNKTTNAESENASFIYAES